MCISPVKAEEVPYKRGQMRFEQGLGLLPTHWQVGLNISNLHFWGSHSVLTAIPKPSPHTRFPSLYVSLLSRVKALQNVPLPGPKKVPKKSGRVKSSPSSGTPAPAPGLSPGDWERVHVCCLRGTHL